MTHKGGRLTFVLQVISRPVPPQMAGQQAHHLPRPVNGPVVPGFVEADIRDLGELWEAGLVRSPRRETSWNLLLLYQRGCVVSLGPPKNVALFFHSISFQCFYFPFLWSLGWNLCCLHAMLMIISRWHQNIELLSLSVLTHAWIGWKNFPCQHVTTIHPGVLLL